MNKTAEEVLLYLKDLLENNLEELFQAKKTEFILGEQVAYVECLEVVQRWKHAERVGLNYVIENRFPLE